MEYTRLGKTGLKVSRICLGTMTYGTSKWRDWVLDEQDARPFIQRALEAGINFFDCANVYSSGEAERILGEIIPEERDRLIVTTKVGGAMGPPVISSATVRQTRPRSCSVEEERAASKIRLMPCTTAFW